jgi:PBSX family phage terminase large subunit
VSEPGLSRKQVLAIDEATARVNILEGAVRSGKSIAADFAWLNFIRNAPTGGELVMMGRTKTTVTRNVINVLKQAAIFGKEIAQNIIYTDGADTATILGRTVHIIGANDVQSEAKVRGMTVAGAYVDEATVLPQVTFQQLVARMSVHGARLFATTNPDSPHHWLKKDWIDRRDRDIRVFHFELDDNPFLDPAFVAYLKRQYTGLWFQRFIRGRWVMAEGAIYDMFDRRRHVVANTPRIADWLAVGVDYGTTNPFHAVMIGLGVDSRLYATAEYRYDSRAQRRQLADAEYSGQLRAWFKRIPIPGSASRGVTPRYIVVDPSATSFRVQLHQDGIASWPADNSVLDGIRLVSTLLAATPRPQLLIHRSCKHLIEELQGYSWDEAAQRKGEDKPIKLADHGPDALRYGIKTTHAIWQSILEPVAA